jgi:hypothetical protein
MELYSQPGVLPKELLSQIFDELRYKSYFRISGLALTSQVLDKHLSSLIRISDLVELKLFVQRYSKVAIIHFYTPLNIIKLTSF